jgi:hypothetical protein
MNKLFIIIFVMSLISCSKMKQDIQRAEDNSSHAVKLATKAQKDAAAARQVTDEIQQESGGFTITPLQSKKRQNFNSNNHSFSISSRLIEEHYRDNGDGTVTDVTTNLQWMRCSLGQTWTGSMCRGNAQQYSLQDAVNVSYRFNYAEHSDWRLPTIDEVNYQPLNAIAF